MIERRAILTGLAGFASCAIMPTLAGARSQGRTIRIGVIAFAERGVRGHLEQSLIAGLRAKGYVEGVNLVVDVRYADGHAELVPRIAKELAATPLDAIVTTCTPTTRAMKAVEPQSPIVMAAVSDPVGQGLIASLAHPGGNITGRASLFEDLAAKMFQLLREAVPKGNSIAVVFNPRNPVHKVFLAEIDAAARSMDVAVSALEIGRSEQIAAALDGARLAGAVLVLPDDSYFYAIRHHIVDGVVKRRVPAMFGLREAVEEGALMSYGESLSQSYYRLAHYIDQIAQGAKPAQLPVEQPTRFEFVINLTTAKALGLTISSSLLIRADEVIE
jgi:putative ABC transport system substrate-binding protein